MSGHEEADLAQLEQWLPGEYDNRSQTEADARQGRELHPALALSIVPVSAILLGRHAFYMHETDVNDPRRITAQHVISFEVGKHGQIVQALWSLVEPQRWRDGNTNPDIFKGLQSQDLSLVAGCELVWTKEGARFVGVNESQRCHLSSAPLAGVRTELRSELSAVELATAELVFDAQGKLVQGRADEPFYRFRKHGGAAAAGKT
jgi:hypothetical protein